MDFVTINSIKIPSSTYRYSSLFCLFASGFPRCSR